MYVPELRRSKRVCRAHGKIDDSSEGLEPGRGFPVLVFSESGWQENRTVGWELDLGDSVVFCRPKNHETALHSSIVSVTDLTVQVSRAHMYQRTTPSRQNRR